MEISEWLRGLGLEQYAPAFRDNDIDGEVLRRLTGEDLRELGVLVDRPPPPPHLDAIAALGAGDVRRPPTTTAPAQSRGRAAAAHGDVLRSGRLDGAVDALRPRGSARDHRRLSPRVAETVGRFEGFVAKYMGDGVLVYFGYPEAHEDDAERAVRAGLAVIDAVGRLATPERLNVGSGSPAGSSWSAI